LDGVRGTAILLVVLCHAALMSPTPAGIVGHTVHDALLSGWMGVDVFFVLSGFLITGILVDARGDGERPPPGYFRSFYARRVLRIFPLYYLFVTSALLVAHANGKPAEHGTWWYWIFLPNVLMARYGWLAATPGTGHLWSLAVEEQFYIVWPTLIAWLPRRSMWVTCLALLVASPLLRIALVTQGHGVAAYTLTFARADALAFGACVALLVRDERRRYIGQARIVAGVAALVLIAFLMQDRLSEPYGVWGLIGGSEPIAILTASCIYLIVADDALRRLANPVMVSFGKYSYAMYLVHVPIRMTIVRWVAAHVTGDWAILAANYAGLLAASWAMAWVSWRVIERPALSLKRFVPMPVSAELPAA
jgi:peptidoglycan/LPS O-acetylase OafA/YrhL